MIFGGLEGRVFGVNGIGLGCLGGGDGKWVSGKGGKLGFRRLVEMDIFGQIIKPAIFRIKILI